MSLAVLTATERPNRRIVMLAAQAFALGLSTAWLMIGATSIFLESFGADALPVTYIGAAFAGATVTAVLTRTLRTRPLTTVAIRVLAIFVVALMSSWVLLRAWDAMWVSFVLLVLVPIVVPVGFMFIVGQAGMLLDVRALKASYPRVIAGFSAGFLVGGLAGPVLLTAVETLDLLVVAALAAGVLIALLVATTRTYPTELSVVADQEQAGPRPTVRSLMSDRFVRLIITFQMLSALESQWLDFLVNDRAAQRYTDTSELATFLSRFYSIAFGADILFLLLIAGLLLRRFGLRYGLAANPGVVLAIVVTIIAATVVAGSGATVVFVLIVAARVADLTLADGAARASLSAAYQAVPTRQRTAAQALVEGLGVPVAIGFSGVVLLVLRATVGTGTLALPVITSLVVLVWAIVAGLVYRGYRTSLLDNLRHRVLDPTELTVDETNGVEVIDRLLQSDDDRDVRLGLDALDASGHPEVVARLVSLATGPRIHPRVEALERLTRAAPSQAHDAAVAGLDHEAPVVRAASLRALTLAGGVADVARVTALTDDSDDDVAVAAFSALSRIGDDDTHRRIATELAALTVDADASRRILAARILAEIEPVAGIDRAQLDVLLTDRDPEVRNAALSALKEEDAARLDLVVGQLADPRTAARAVDAMVRLGEPAVAVCDLGLGGQIELDRRAQELLARVCRERGGERSADVLRRHIGHPDREVGLAVMTALAALHTTPSTSDDGTVAITDLLGAEVRHAARVLQFLQLAPDSSVLHLALQDEFTLTRRRVLAALSLRYGTEPLGRVTFQLRTNDPRSHALALEWLDVTLSASDKAAIALLEPERSVEERGRALARVAPVPSVTWAEAVIDLAEDPEGRWQSPWLTSCALLAASELPEVDLEDLLDRLQARPPAASADLQGLVEETIAGIRGRRQTR